MDKTLILREQTLYESEDRYRALLDGVGVAVGLVDKNYHQIISNKKMTSLRIYPSSEETRTHCYQDFWGRDDICPDCPGQQAMATRKPALSEVTRKNSKGELRILRIIASPIFDTAQQVTGFTEVVEDVTEEKETATQLKELAATLEQRVEDRTEALLLANLHLEQDRVELESAKKSLEKANRELKSSQTFLIQKEKMASIGQLAAGIAHEINNPMSYILSNLSVLENYMKRLKRYVDEQGGALKKLDDRDKKEEILQLKKKLKIDFLLDDSFDLIAESVDGAGRVTDIVKSMKIFSRNDEIEKKEADINENLENTINIIWNEIKYSATLIREFGSLPLVKCYPRQLSQVFMNLIVNASHAVESDGQITLKTWATDNSVLISITDNGCGISEENKDRIFEPFFTTKEVGVGTGLGMSIAYEIIKKHHGEISLVSKIGVGTTFTIELPFQ